MGLFAILARRRSLRRCERPITRKRISSYDQTPPKENSASVYGGDASCHWESTKLIIMAPSYPKLDIYSNKEILLDGAIDAFRGKQLIFVLKTQ